MGFDQQMGEMYPFSPGEKLEKITEVWSWQGRATGAHSPWRRPIVPFEMVSVLTEYTKDVVKWKIRSPRVGLFADLEIRMLGGPVFVGERYLREREVVALSESRRTESFWVRTILREEKSGRPVVSALLNHAVVKDSFPGYKEERGE